MADSISVTVTVKDIREIKTMTKPPQMVKELMTATLILLGDSNTDWRAASKFLKSPDCLSRIQAFDPAKCSPEAAARARQVLDAGAPAGLDGVKKVSMAASGLFKWADKAIGIVQGK